MKELEALKHLEHFDNKALLSYYLYPAALGEWHAQIGKIAEAREYFEEAIQLTHSPTEKKLLQNKISKLF